MAHSSQALVISCSDPRLNAGGIEAVIVREMICSNQNFDRLIWPGGGKDLLSTDPAIVDYWLAAIKKLWELHHFPKIVLIWHDTCGAYGISNLHEEETTQTTDLAAITQLLAEKFSQLTVERFILQGTDTGDFSLKRV
ncbi:MAG: hypothetical protein WCX08_04415 [Candidatus Buchananbacteria bacterium]